MKLENFVVCEDARTEANGKLILIGVFPGNQINLLGPKPKKGTGEPQAVLQLSFYVALTNLGKPSDLEIEIKGPRGSVVFERRQFAIPDIPSASKCAIVCFGIKQVKLPYLGKYQFLGFDSKGKKLFTGRFLVTRKPHPDGKKGG